MTARHANTWMTIDEQVAFAWKYRDHFAGVATHNLERVTTMRSSNEVAPLRNAWIELADMTDAKADEPKGAAGQLDMFAA